MARVHTKESRVLVNEFSTSCDLTGYGLTHSRNMTDVTTLSDEGHTFTPGLLSGSLSLRGVFDATAGSFYAEAKDSVGVDDGYLVLVAPAGYTVGAPAFLTVSDLSDFSVDASVTDAITVQITAAPDNGVDWGVTLHALTAETADGDGSTVDQAAATTNGGVADLHVTAFSGFSGVVFKVQHSSNGSAWSDLITFTTAAAATSEHKTVTGTINRYVRCTWDVTGTGSATFVIGFARR